MLSPTRSVLLGLVLGMLSAGCDMFVTCDPETGDGCTTGTEKGNCTPHFRQGCSSGNALSWYDSCNNIESLISNCPQGCVNNQCLGGCTEAWSCGSWSSCSCEHMQVRTCTDSNSCGTSNSKPVESQTCNTTCGNGTCDCGETTASCPVDCSGTSGTCVDDSFELNNDPASAKAINPGTLTNLKICPSNMDFYRINVPSGYLLTVRIDFDHATGNLDLKLFQDTGMELDSSTSFSNYEYVEGTGTGSNLLIEVFGVGAIANSYTMTVETHSMCTPDISCGSWGTCTCAGGTGIMSRWCTDTLCGNPSYEETQSCSTCGNGTCDSACAETMGNCPADCDDPYEPNDTNATPTDLTNPGTLGSLNLVSGNVDWYKLWVPANQTLQAQINFTHASGDLDLEIQTAGGTLLDKSDTSSKARNFEHADAPSVGEYLYIKVYGVSGAGNTYSLDTNYCTESWSYEPWGACLCEGTGTRYRLAWDSNACGTTAQQLSLIDSSCVPTDSDGACDCGEDTVNDPIDCDDAYEPNDVRPDAYTGIAGAVYGLSLSPGDDDWYEAYVRYGFQLSASINFVQANGDLNLQIWNKTFNLPLSTSDSGYAPETLLYTSDGGTYYARVYGSNTAMTTYDLTMTTNCLADGFEPNETILEAKEVTPSAMPYTYLTICNLQFDWYYVEVPAGQTLVWRIDYKAADGDLDLYLHDSAGAVLANSTTIYDSDEVLWTNPHTYTEIYYMKVQPHATDNGYQMTVTLSY